MGNELRDRLVIIRCNARTVHIPKQHRRAPGLSTGALDIRFEKNLGNTRTAVVYIGLVYTKAWSDVFVSRSELVYDGSQIIGRYRGQRDDHCFHSMRVNKLGLVQPRDTQHVSGD